MSAPFRLSSPDGGGGFSPFMGSGTEPEPELSPSYDFSTMADFFKRLGFEGATSAADIVRMLGEQRGTTISPGQQAEWGRDLEALLGETGGGLEKLPGLFSTLTGQAQESARIGREGIRGSFLGERGGLERAALGQAQQFRTGIARSGFAGSGALRRERATGRKALGQQFGQLLGRRRTGLEGVESGLERGLFGARTTVEEREGSLLAALGGGIQNLLATMRGEGVFAGEGTVPEPSPGDPGPFAEEPLEDLDPGEVPPGGEIGLTYQQWLDSPFFRSGMTVQDYYDWYFKQYGDR